MIIVIKTQHNEPRTSSAFLSGIRKPEIIFAFHFLSEGTSFSNKELLQVHKKVQRSGGKMDRGHKSRLQEGKRAFKHREGWITLLILGDVHVIILWRNYSLELDEQSLKFYNILRENESAIQ